MSHQLVPAPVGIDLGSYKSKIAVAKRGGVQVITNQANFRQTPCIVGYGSAQRNIGEAGNIKMKSNFKDTIVAPMRYLGLDTHYPMLRAETKYTPARNNTSQGRLKFQVNYQGQKISVLPQQAMAAYLNKMKLTILKNGFENKQAVVAVPAYLTQPQRKAFLDAAKIAELNITRLLNDSTAIALDYGMFRKNQLDGQKARNVLFVDFGHSKLSVFACSFTKTQMNFLEQQYTRNLGCRDIDFHLYQFYRGIFQKSSGGLDVSESKKAYVKLMENIQRQRKVLSGNLEHDLNIEYLMEENDIHYTMKRQQFQQISEPIFNQIKRILVKVREELKAKNINIHSIQLVGGGSRIPYFLQCVKDAYGIQPMRTLNSSQSVARGCALMAAIKSPLMKVPDYTLNQKVYNGVKFYWNFVEGNNYLGLDSSLYPQKQGRFIYDFGATVPSSKTIKFSRKQPMQILIEYQPSVIGFNKHIGYFKTPAQNPQHQTFGVTFKIKYTENGLVTFEQCNLVEEWTQQTKVPKKKQTKKQQKKEQPKQGQKPQQKVPMEEQQFEIKKTKKQQQKVVKFQSNTFDLNTEKQIHHYFTVQSEMLNKDRVIIQTYERKNQLESIVYKWKQNLQTTHKEFAIPQQIPAILQLLEVNGEWLYNQGQNASRGVYTQRIQAIRNKINGIVKRWDVFHAIAQQVSNFVNCLKVNFELLNSLDKKYEHITVEQRQQSFNLIQRMKTWIKHVQEKQSHKKKWEEPATNVAEIQKNIKQVNQHVKKTMNKPVPKPPAPEKKPQQQKQQKMEVQQQNKTTQNNSSNGTNQQGAKMETQ